MKRVFDIISCSLAVILLLPLEMVIAICIVCGSKGGVFYKQVRVGKGNKDFKLLKFRTMRPNADKQGLLITVGADNRITKIGHFLRKYKLDELPQFLNIIKGDMSVVGPRPEVRRYVDLYNERQLRVLSVRPGLTDYASIEYISESELLAKSDNPEKTYIEEVMPAKLELNLKYIEKQSIGEDIRLIFKTLGKIAGK
ncbi:MAG: sugar transferase [Bacteroidales bacterium]|nr:sugar transferase [Bacteroidales bacterium]